VETAKNVAFVSRERDNNRLVAVNIGFIKERRLGIWDGDGYSLHISRELAKHIDEMIIQHTN
jgi:hypothetical protein